MCAAGIEPLELQTNDPAKVVRFAEVCKFRDGGYTCQLEVMSGGFSCRRPFYFDDGSLNKAIGELETMLTGRPGKFLLKEVYELDWVGFELNDVGHVFVSGEINELADMRQQLQFWFRTDQTVLPRLRRDLLSLRNL
jgi:hypothetical protein